MLSKIIFTKYIKYKKEVEENNKHILAIRHKNILRNNLREQLKREEKLKCQLESANFPECSQKLKKSDDTVQ